MTLATVGWRAPDLEQRAKPAQAAAEVPSPPVASADRSREPDRQTGPARQSEESRHWSAPVDSRTSAPLTGQIYSTQPGDTLQAIALRFGVTPADLQGWNEAELPAQGLLPPGTPLRIQAGGPLAGPQRWRLPDSELVYSPSASGFDIEGLAARHGGYLYEYRERVEGEWLQGPEVVLRAARDHSVNPRLLLAILELRSGWLTDPELPRGSAMTYPIWPGDARLQGLYLQLSWAANELSHAYYGWRQGTLPELPLRDGSTLSLAPDLNAATVALEYLSALMSPRSQPAPGPVANQIMGVYRQLFGDPWNFDYPLFGAGVAQPELGLPFPAENPWVFTGGPHGGWGTESAWAALDFAPKWDRRRRTSDKELVALTDAVVARVERGVVVLDLDGDGLEQTGWSILYLHILPAEGIQVGTNLRAGEPMGVAAEEGGVSHGLHLHIARKYNGEWIAADGPLPMDLDGWRVRAGPESYLGVLYRSGQELLACPYGSLTLLSVGGGSAIPGPDLPDNLRGCWPVPGASQATLQAGEVVPTEPTADWPGHTPAHLPSTRLLCAVN